MSQRTATESATLPPQAGDIVFVEKEQRVIAAIQTGLFGAVYHNNVHDVVCTDGSEHHVRRYPSKDKPDGRRAWRHAPHSRQ